MNPEIDYSQLPLQDIHLPGEVAWWPPAPGWWLLAGLIVAGLALLALHYYRGRHQRAALRALRAVQARLEQGGEPVACLQSVSTVLRRFAMTTADLADPSEPGTLPPDTVAGLIGERWLQYLDGRWQRDEFTHGPGRLLLAAPYARARFVDRPQALELTALCMDWVKAQPRRRRRRARWRLAPQAASAQS